MLEEQTNTNTFETESLPGTTISVTGKEAKIINHDPMTFGETVQVFTQEQIRDFIGILLDAYEKMDDNEEAEDSQMNLFDMADKMNELHDETDMAELVSNATSFLMMQEDFSNDQVSKDDVIGALSILKDSIESYIRQNTEEVVTEIESFETESGF